MWTHTFVCLADTQQDWIPDGNQRAYLQIAGLGEKRITMPDISDAFNINELLIHFPA